jgi:2-polyprenyl-3-methyl-5-hydroxy-6-metoxy-1,4-benzoquinol methylase
MSERDVRKGFRRSRSPGTDEQDVTRRVREFYEQFHFPGIRPLDQDGLILMRRFARSVKPFRHKQRASPFRVLDAGCGTGNTTISLARQFEEIEFLGVDISEPSLSRARQAIIQEPPHNLRFRKWNLMNPILDEGQFDIVLCLGVLHHTADMGCVLTNLNSILKSEGELYLWIYGRHGRYRHSLNQRFLRMLLKTKPQPTDAVHLAREFAFYARNGSVLDDLLGPAPAGSMHRKVLKDPTWIADQFLNPRETLLDMEELIALVTASGFQIDQWLGISDDVSSHLNSAELTERFEQLPRYQQLIALDLLLKLERYFVVIRKAEDKKGETQCIR